MNAAHTPYAMLYRAMVRELARCRQLNLPEEEYVSTAFRIAIDYWEQVKMQFLQQGDNEIYFFKVIKPTFQRYIQFYILLAEVLLFVPGSLTEAINFWKEERERVHWFRSVHADFERYIESGSTDCDEFYFTRLPDDYPLDDFIFSYDRDSRVCSLKDQLLSRLLAYELFGKYCERKMRSLSKLIPIGK